MKSEEWLASVSGDAPISAVLGGMIFVAAIGLAWSLLILRRPTSAEVATPYDSAPHGGGASMSARRMFARAAALAILLATTNCGGLYFGDNPGREFPKETGPLTVPPASVRNGTR